MPRCSACGETRPLHDFNVARNRPSGCQAYCRRCSREKSQEYQRRQRELPSFRRAEVDRQVDRYASEPGYRSRKLARSRARHALERGAIQRAPCRCGNPRAEMHFEDYSKPLEVKWLCRACRQRDRHGPDYPRTEGDPIAEMLERIDARRNASAPLRRCS